MRVATVLLTLGALAPLAAGAPTAGTSAYAGSWCDDHSPCWWYETCEYENGLFEGPCTGWLSAQHAWSFGVCAGDEEAIAQWSVVANDVLVSAGYWLLAPGECYQEAGQGTSPLVDCALVAVTLTPLAPREPLVSHAIDCGGSLVSL